MIRFAALGSGSEGNATVIEAHPESFAKDAKPVTRILLDCGFPTKELERRLAQVGLGAGGFDGVFDAVLVTHEHGDHASGALKAARRLGCPLFGTFGTLMAAFGTTADPNMRIISAQNLTFSINHFTIKPIAVAHDAQEPVQYRIDCEQLSFGVLTDLGMPTAAVIAGFSGLDGMILECNHDEQMLKTSRYHPNLKKRVGGDWGHLSNRQAADLYAKLHHDKLQQVWCAHLSKNNNQPHLAQTAIAAVRGCAPEAVSVLDQHAAGAWFEIK